MISSLEWCSAVMLRRLGISGSARWPYGAGVTTGRLSPSTWLKLSRASCTARWLKRTKRSRNYAIFSLFRPGHLARFRVAAGDISAGRKVFGSNPSDNRSGGPHIQDCDRMTQTCTICPHPRRLDIEADLISGAPYRDIARRHHLSKDALTRHRSNHMPSTAATALTAVREIVALLDQAATAASWNSTLLAIRAARNRADELCEIVGWL
jgi:hypothetical protein